MWWFPAGWLLVQAHQSHLKTTRPLEDVWQAQKQATLKADQEILGSNVHWQWLGLKQIVIFAFEYLVMAADLIFEYLFCTLK